MNSNYTKSLVRFAVCVVVAFMLVLLVGVCNAEVISYEKVWSAIGTDTTTWVSSTTANEAQVTIVPNGSQDGTFTVSVCPSQVAASCTVVGTVAASSSTTVTYAGTSQAFLYLSLSGNTPATGAIDVYVILKR